jgi:hypothetical protein
MHHISKFHSCIIIGFSMVHADSVFNDTLPVPEWFWILDSADFID